VLAHDIRVFRRDGSFVRTLGRLGEGPGEFQVINNIWVSPGDTLHVIDAASLRRTVLSPEFETLETSRLPGAPFAKGYLGLKDGESVLTAFAPDSVGEFRLLHFLGRDGRRTLSFGPRLDRATPFNAPQASFIRVLAVDETGNVLVAPAPRFQVEFYDREGVLGKVFRLSGRDWTELVPGGGQIPGYDPWIQDLWVDGEDRLWVLMRVGDPDWREAVERTTSALGRGPRTRMTDYNGFWDTVVEVIDLEVGRTIARERFDHNLLRFLGRNEVTGRTVFEDGTFKLPVLRLLLERDLIPDPFPLVQRSLR
jgi:hypothetical protein